MCRSVDSVRRYSRLCRNVAFACEFITKAWSSWCLYFDLSQLFDLISSSTCLIPSLIASSVNRYAIPELNTPSGRLPAAGSFVPVQSLGPYRYNGSNGYPKNAGSVGLEYAPVQVQCCLTSTETVRTVRDEEPRKATSTFTNSS